MVAPEVVAWKRQRGASVALRCHQSGPKRAGALAARAAARANPLPATVTRVPPARGPPLTETLKAVAAYIRYPSSNVRSLSLSTYCWPLRARLKGRRDGR